MTTRPPAKHPGGVWGGLRDSAVVSADFRMTVATLKDGRVLNGFVVARTELTFTLKTMT